jgi:thymidylate kinase
MSVGDTIPGARSTLGVVRDLCAALEAEGIAYCHWKSNAFLDASRSGENDLDLLVARADGAAFSTIVHRLGFRQALNPRKLLPGVVDYFAHDEDARRPVHLHVHYQLVVGDDLTKNYRIPLEEAFLAETVRDGEFLVPRPELELILLVIRLALKHATWEAVLLRRATIPPGALTEYRFLEARADRNVLDRMLQQFLPTVDASALDACAQAVSSGSGKWRRVRASRPLLQSLQPYARRGRAADVGLKVGRRAAGILGRLGSRPPSRKRLLAGGRVIAFVGADGAGKSTLVGEVRAWLAKDLSVTALHLGRPPRSMTTHVVRTIVRAGSVPGRIRRIGGVRPREGTAPGPLRAAFAVALARDRAASAAKARALAANGALVVSDRWPLPELELMDGPRVERLLGGRTTGPLRRRLVALERRYYREVGRPDVAIVLRVDPEVAVARKPEEDPEFVRRRWREIWAVDWAAVTAHVVDAGDPPDEVLARVKAIIWSEL